MPNRMSWTRRLVTFVLVASVLMPVVAAADQRSDLLIRMLTTSPEFRVRTQAALSLGRTDGGADVVAALVRALADSNAAVRAAAATALGTVGDASSLAALRRAQQDSDSGVRRAATGSISSVESRSGGGATAASTATTAAAVATTSSSGTESTGATYYVGIGATASRAPRIGSDLLQHARTVIVSQVRNVGGTEIAPDNESTDAAASVIRRRRLSGVYLECSIVSADATASGTRVAVSIIVGTYPGRDMRAILNGAATVPGASGPEADRMAVEGAIRGALRNLPQAMASAGR